jgi:uncharacterized protein (DUF1778 family)
MPAKRPTDKSRPAPKRRATATASKQAVSVRFSPDERSVIDDAAREVGQSVARLVQDAAVKRAYDVLNAGAAKDRLPALAREWAQRIVDPSAVVTGSFDDEPYSNLIHSSNGSLPLCSEDTPEDHPEFLSITKPTGEEIRELELALENAATEFTVLLHQEIVNFSPERERFEPVHRRPSGPAGGKQED